MNSDANKFSPENGETRYGYQTEEWIPNPDDPNSCRRVVTTTYTVVRPPVPPTFEHDTQKRLFILTHADGKIEQFRDNPARHLVVEPDPETGEMRPVLVGGKAKCFYLCREERDL
jgi:hypothetical protein